MEKLYSPDDRDREVFGDQYDPPARFEHGEYHRVARYKSANGEVKVEIDECRMPARFFRIRVLGDRPFVLVTGSSMGELAHRIATEIARSMLGLEREE